MLMIACMSKRTLEGLDVKRVETLCIARLHDCFDAYCLAIACTHCQGSENGKEETGDEPGGPYIIKPRYNHSEDEHYWLKEHDIADLPGYGEVLINSF